MSIDIGSRNVGFKGRLTDERETMSASQERLGGLGEVQGQISGIVGREAGHSMSRCGGDEGGGPGFKGQSRRERDNQCGASMNNSQMGMPAAMGQTEDGEDAGIARQLDEIRQSQMLLGAMGTMGGSGGFGGLGDFGGMGGSMGSINPLMMQMLRAGNMESVKMMMGGMGSLGGSGDIMSLLGGGKGVNK